MADNILWQLVGNVGNNWGQQFNAGYDRGHAMATRNNRKSILESLATGPDGNLDIKSGVTQLIKSGDAEGALQIGQLNKVFAPETTDEIKEYNLYRRQGGDKPFNDWKIALKQAGATRINNTVQTGDNQYSKTLGEADAKGFIDLNKSGTTAGSKLNTITALDNLMKDPNFYSGFGGPTQLRAKQALASFGVANPDVASAQETFNALSQKFVLDLAGGSLGTGFSNADRDFLQGQVPNLQNTPDGNKRLIDYMRKVAQREQQVSQLARQYTQRNKGRFDQAGFNDFITQWAEQNPLFPSAPTQQQPQAAPGQQQQQQPRRLRFNPNTGTLE